MINNKIPEKPQKETSFYYLHPLTKTIEVNERKIKYVGISSHCGKHIKHGITCELIIDLVKLLDIGDFDLDGKQEEHKNYFKAYPEIDSKRYKLVWWWWKEVDTYLWVRTCHPDDE